MSEHALREWQNAMVVAVDQTRKRVDEIERSAPKQVRELTKMVAACLEEIATKSQTIHEMRTTLHAMASKLADVEKSASEIDARTAAVSQAILKSTIDKSRGRFRQVPVRDPETNRITHVDVIPID